MPVLQKACCCLELATGAAILGWLGVVGSIINVIASIVQLTQPESSAGTFIVNIITGVLQLAISIMLIRGAMTRNRRLVLPWLAVTIINLIIINITFIYVIFATGEFSLLGSIIIVDLLVGYFWACVYSFYQEQEGNPGGIV